MEILNQDLRKTALLVRVNTTKWGIVRQDKDVGDKAAADNGANPELVKAMKSLISDKTPIWKEVKKAFNAITSAHLTTTGSWGSAKGDYRVISCEAFGRYQETVDHLRSVAMAKADDFAFNHYEALRRDAEQRYTGLGDMFDADLYPSAQEVRDCFTVTSDQMLLPEDGGHLVLALSQSQQQTIGDSAKAREASRFKALAEETQKRIGDELSKVIEAVTTYGDEGVKRPKNFGNTLISRVSELVEVIKATNITQDPAIDALAMKMADKLTKVTVDDLRGKVKGDKRSEAIKEAEASKLRSELADSAKDIAADLDGIFG